MAKGIRSSGVYGVPQFRFAGLGIYLLILVGHSSAFAADAVAVKPAVVVTLASIPAIQPAVQTPVTTILQPAPLGPEKEKQGPVFSVVIAPPPQPALAPKEPATLPLDSKRIFALGMIETGNDDEEVGTLGEISRYQIHPVVWKAYSKSHDYRNPEVALQVAQQHWNYLACYFKDKAGRLPDDYDMYVLWNTRFGYYAHQGFDRHRIFHVVQDRAQRFVNLVNR